MLSEKQNKARYRTGHTVYAVIYVKSRNKHRRLCVLVCAFVKYFWKFPKKLITGSFWKTVVEGDILLENLVPFEV